MQKIVVLRSVVACNSVRPVVKILILNSNCSLSLNYHDKFSKVDWKNRRCRNSVFFIQNLSQFKTWELNLQKIAQIFTLLGSLFCNVKLDQMITQLEYIKPSNGKYIHQTLNSKITHTLIDIRHLYALVLRSLRTSLVEYKVRPQILRNRWHHRYPYQYDSAGFKVSNPRHQNYCKLFVQSKN